MKIWATSCLHLSHATSLSDRARIASYVRALGDDDIVILAGDIIDPGLDHFYAGWLNGLLDRQEVVYLPGNHDLWHRNVNFRTWTGLSPESPTFYRFGLPLIYGFTGWNYAGPSWANHHPTEEGAIGAVLDEIHRVAPRIVVTHYPFWWGADRSASPYINPTLQESGVEKVVFGHLHQPHTWPDCPQSQVPGIDLYNVAAVGREIPFTLVDMLDE